MSLYTVHAPVPPGDLSALDPADIVLVKDGFSWPAFMFGGLWLLVLGMWRELLAFLVLAVAGSML
ncbi:MAG: DUF2628 domain-containing protein [Hyphomicrobiaceae bacterium]